MKFILHARTQEETGVEACVAIHLGVVFVVFLLWVEDSIVGLSNISSQNVKWERLLFPQSDREEIYVLLTLLVR